MKRILKYDIFINEMWDINPDIEILKEEIKDEENFYTEFKVDGFEYSVTIIVRRREEEPQKFSLEIHFNSKDAQGTFSNDLTGRNNMQKVMGGVWLIVIKWAKEVCKGGYLTALIVSAKSENERDDRRSKIYANFIEKKAKQTGMIIKGTEDITDLYNEMFNILNDSIVKVCCVKIVKDNLPNIPGSSSWVPNGEIVDNRYIKSISGTFMMTFKKENFFIPQNIELFFDTHIHKYVKEVGGISAITLINESKHLTWDYYYDGNPYYEWKKNNQWVLTAHRKETKFNQVI